MMLNYGFNHGLGASLTIDDAGVIKTDNAYLNPSLLQAMKCDGLTRSL